MSTKGEVRIASNIIEEQLTADQRQKYFPLQSIANIDVKTLRPNNRPIHARNKSTKSSLILHKIILNGKHTKYEVIN